MVKGGSTIDVYYILKTPQDVESFVLAITEMTLQQIKWATDITIMPEVRIQIQTAVVSSTMDAVIKAERERQ
jgi:hypothetical protein